MKKTYEKPFAEKIEFSYSQQVVASGGGGDRCYWSGSDDYTHWTTGCKDLLNTHPNTQVPA